MLTYVKGNLFDSPAKVLVNTVNTVGVMGKGIAKTFKEIYPEMFLRYQHLCESGQFDVGNLWVYKTPTKWVLNFPTKKHWRNPSRLEYIESGLRKFSESYSREGITSVAFPQLGCGNGELEWKDVEPLMLRYLKNLPISCYIYLFDKAAESLVEHKNIQSMRAWLRTEPRALAFEEFWTDLKSIVGQGRKFETFDATKAFKVEIGAGEQEGLLIHFGDRTALQKIRDFAIKLTNKAVGWSITPKDVVFIPTESVTEVWQAIRFNGFYFSRTSAPGLECFTEYLLPLLSELSYMRTVRVSGTPNSQLEVGVQLLVTEPEQPTTRHAVTAEVA